MDALNIHRVLAKNKENMLNQRLAISLLSCVPEALWDTPQPSLPPFAIASHLTFSLPVCKLPLNLNLSMSLPIVWTPFCSFGFHWRVSSIKSVLQTLRTCPFSWGRRTSCRAPPGSRLPPFSALPAPHLRSEKVGHGCWFSRQSREVSRDLQRDLPTTLCTLIRGPLFISFLNWASKKHFFGRETLWLKGNVWRKV